MKPRIKPSLLSRLCTSTCLMNGPEDLTEEETSMNQTLHVDPKLEKVSLLERLSIGENKVLNEKNPFGSVASSTSSALNEPSALLQQVSSPQISHEPMRSFLTGRKIPKKSDVVSCITGAVQNSMKQDGQKLSQANVLTSTQYTPSYPLHAPLTSVPKPLETLRSNMPERRKQCRRKSRLHGNGLQPGIGLLEPSNLLSLIERMSSPPMENTSTTDSTYVSRSRMRESSDSTRLSGTGQPTHVGLNSVISQPSQTSTSLISNLMDDIEMPMMKSSPSPVLLHGKELLSVGVNPAANGITENVPAVPVPAAMHMSAHLSKMGGCAHVDIRKRNTSRSPSPSLIERPLKRPRHRRGLIWSPTDVSFSPTARSSEYAEPVPTPPLNKVSDSDAAQTVAQRPDLFRIVTPINVNRFEELLADHPNQPFVISVCRALRQGFWPWADTSDDSYPSINDNSAHTCTKTAEQEQFIDDQIREEIRLGRVSESFGMDLYPGMYSVPMHTVPKPNSDKLRLVVDHTAGDYSLNSMIECDAIKGTKLDGLHSLGVSLLRFREQHPNVELVLFKSDVSQAFRRLPMHPLWQVKQILTVHGQRHVDRNNNFGGRGSPKVWISFMSLVAWIAIHHILIDALKTYMDDSFSFEITG